MMTTIKGMNKKRLVLLVSSSNTLSVINVEYLFYFYLFLRVLLLLPKLTHRNVTLLFHITMHLLSFKIFNFSSTIYYQHKPVRNLGNIVPNLSYFLEVPQFAEQNKRKQFP